MVHPAAIRARPHPPSPDRNKKGLRPIGRNPLTYLVELTGFEPVAS